MELCCMEFRLNWNYGSLIDRTNGILVYGTLLCEIQMYGIYAILIQRFSSNRIYGIPLYGIY